MYLRELHNSIPNLSCVSLIINFTIVTFYCRWIRNYTYQSKDSKTYEMNRRVLINLLNNYIIKRLLKFHDESWNCPNHSFAFIIKFRSKTTIATKQSRLRGRKALALKEEHPLAVRRVREEVDGRGAAQLERQTRVALRRPAAQVLQVLGRAARVARHVHQLRDGRAGAQRTHQLVAQAWAPTKVTVFIKMLNFDVGTKQSLWCYLGK